MGTCIGLEGEVSQTCKGTERLLQQGNQRLSTSNGMLGLFWMQILELRQRCHLLIDLRIVFHRTRAKRIEACINPKIIIREVGVMTYYRQFVALRQSSIFCPT